MKTLANNIAWKQIETATNTQNTLKNTLSSISERVSKTVHNLLTLGTSGLAILWMTATGVQAEDKNHEVSVFGELKGSISPDTWLRDAGGFYPGETKFDSGISGAGVRYQNKNLKMQSPFGGTLSPFVQGSFSNVDGKFTITGEDTPLSVKQETITGGIGVIQQWETKSPLINPYVWGMLGVSHTDIKQTHPDGWRLEGDSTDFAWEIFAGNEMKLNEDGSFSFFVEWGLKNNEWLRTEGKAGDGTPVKSEMKDDTVFTGKAGVKIEF